MPLRSPSREKTKAQRRNARAIIKQRLADESAGKPAGDARDGQAGGGEGKPQDEKETSEAVDAAAVPVDNRAAKTSTQPPASRESTIMPSKGVDGGVSIQESELPIFGKTAGRSNTAHLLLFKRNCDTHCYSHRSTSRAKARSPTRGAANLRHAPAGQQRRNQRGSG
jgi:hypothetical protein